MNFAKSSYYLLILPHDIIECGVCFGIIPEWVCSLAEYEYAYPTGATANVTTHQSDFCAPNSLLGQVILPL